MCPERTENRHLCWIREMRFDMTEDERNEKLGRAVVNIRWILFAISIIVGTTLIAGVILFLLGKPLWIAPIIGVGVFIVYRLFWHLIWKLIAWASRQ